MRFASLLLIVLISVAVSCGSDSSGTASRDANSKKRVRVVKAAQTKLPRVVSVSGTLAAEEEVTIAPKVQGRVRQVFVDLGSPVKSGQPLMELEPADFQLRVQQSEAAYQQARVRLGLDAAGNDDSGSIDLEQTSVVRQAKAQLTQADLTRARRDSLYKEGLIPKSDLDDAEAAYQVASARYEDALEEVRNRQALLIQRKAELDLARQQYSDSVLRAPVNGSIQQRQVSPGEFVTVGESVFKLVRIHPLRLKLALPERESGDVRVGQKVQLHVEGDDNLYAGNIARLSPAITADNRTLMVEAEVPNEDGRLRPGSFARAEIITQPDLPSILIPSSSVVTFAGIQKVIVIANNQTVEKRIQIGRKIDNRLEVIDGIVAGDAVVIEPGNLTAGEAVEPIW